MDHLLPVGRTLEQFQGFDYVEMNPRIHAAYQIEEVDRERQRLQMSTEAKPDGAESRFTLKKLFSFKRNSISVRYELETPTDLEEKPVFASEINLSLPEPPGERVRVFAMVRGERKPLIEEKVSLRQISELIIEDSVNKACLTLSGSKRFRLWMFPVSTEYATESGQIREYQSTCIVAGWPKTGGNYKNWDATLTLKAEKLTKSR